MPSTKKLLVVVAVVLVVLAVTLGIAARMILGGDAVRVALEQQASAALGQPVSIQTATPRIFPKPAIHLTGVSVGAGRQVTIERASLATGLRALLSRRIENAELRIEGSRIDVRWALTLFDLLSSDQQPAAAGSSSGISIVSVTALDLRDIALLAAGRTLHVDMDSALTEADRLAVTRFDAKSETSELSARGEFSSLANRVGKFEVDAESLDVDGLLAFIAATTPAGSQTVPAAKTATPPPPLKLTIGLKARKGIAAGAGFSNLSATCRVDGDNARLDDLRLNAFDGTFKGIVGLQGSGRQPQFNWRGTFDGLDAAKVAAFAGTSGSITGKLGGSVDIAAAGQDPAAAIRDARGRGRVVLSDGKLPGLEIVRNVILAFGKPTGDRPAGSGESFSHLAATLAVADQRLTTNDLTFASRDFDMTGKGVLSLATQTLDFQVDVILSRELSAQAGRDLYRLAREDDRIILPARITGTVGSPAVFIDVTEALKRALRNRAEDEVKSLFDRLRKKVIRD
jgi:uncharacterized protein involved in outer membrane biogenesis